MITALLIFFGAVLLIPALSEAEFGAAGVIIVVVLVGVFLCAVSRRDARAWNNRQNYWAYGDEPDWKRKRR